MPEEVLIPEINAEKVLSTEVNGDALARPDVPFEKPAEGLREKSAEQYAKILSKISGTVSPANTDATTADAAAFDGITDAQSTITRLVGLAETKGVAHAVAVAQKLGDYYVLDVMHDQLADKLYEALLAKGLVRAE